MSRGHLSLATDNAPCMRIKPMQTVGDILSEPLPTYVIRPLLAHRAVHVLYGDANSGKTFLSLDFAAKIATGDVWQGKRIKTAPTLYVAAEGMGGMVKRLRALVQRYPGLPSAPMRIIRQSIDLIEDAEDLLTSAIDLANNHGAIGLIVLDTLAQTLGGRDENISSDMALYVARATMLADKTGAAILIVHHAGKDAQRGARGHSSLRSNADAMYRVTCTDDGLRTLSTEKAREDEKFSCAFRLRSVPVGVDDDGNEQTSCVVDFVDGPVPPQRRPLTGARQKLLFRLACEVAAAAAAEGRIAPNGKPQIETKRLLEVWQAAAKAAGAIKTNPAAATAAMEALIKEGYLVSVGNGVWTLA